MAMTPNGKDEYWRVLAKEMSQERDSARLLRLAEELIRALDVARQSNELGVRPTDERI